MTEYFITLRGDKAEAFRTIKEEIGPEGVTLDNPAAVMRLIEVYEEQRPPGGLID